MPLSELLHKALADGPDRPAVRYNEQTRSYRRIEDMSDRLAASLLGSGLQPGDRLGFLMHNCTELVLSYLACFKAGIVAVPLNYRYLAPQIDYALEHSDCHALIADVERLGDLDKSAAATQLQQIYLVSGSGSGRYRPFARLLDRPNAAVKLPRVADDALAFIMYTSGTTAKPKGVMHTHATLAHMLDSFQATGPLTRDDVSLVSLSIAHIAGLVGQVFVTLHVGGQVVLVPKFDPGAILDLCARCRPTYLEQLPAPLNEIVKHPKADSTDLRCVRLCIAGGDKVPLPVHRRFQELTGIEIAEVIGMTETFNYAINPPFGPKRLGSVGTPVAGTEVRVVDGAGNPLPAGEVGELIVRSPANMVGYWNNPEETRNTLRDGWIYTGDLGRFDADGWLWFVGRKKDIIIRDGSNISPQEVEDVFYHHPAVRAAGVVGVPNPDHGQVVWAYVVLKDGVAPRPTADELIAFARGQIAHYMAPERIIFLDELPHTATGKVDRKQLREQAAGAA